MTTADRHLGARRRGAILAAALGLSLTGLAGAAQAADPVELSIIDRNTGRPLQVWRHDGRLFVAGQTGGGYCLRVANHTSRRVEVVLSVDGVNIYTGQTAGYDQDGYIYSPYETSDQCGWRKSLREVAAFSFTALPNSYAARTGRPGDVGVVGMAVFYEKPRPPAARRPVQPLRDAPPPVMQREVAPPEPGPPPPPPVMIKPLDKIIVPPPPSRAAPSSGAAAPSAPSDAVVAEAQRSDRLGTAHGALETSRIQLVSFERASVTPVLVRQIEYDSYQNLVTAGVIPPPVHRPQSFPNGGGFVPDPPPLR